MKITVSDVVLFIVLAGLLITTSIIFMEISYNRGLKNGSQRANAQWIRELDKRRIVTAQKGGSFTWRQK